MCDFTLHLSPVFSYVAPGVLMFIQILWCILLKTISKSSITKFITMYVQNKNIYMIVLHEIIWYRYNIYDYKKIIDIIYMIIKKIICDRRGLNYSHKFQVKHWILFLKNQQSTQKYWVREKISCPLFDSVDIFFFQHYLTLKHYLHSPPLLFYPCKMDILIEAWCSGYAIDNNRSQPWPSLRSLSW